MGVADLGRLGKSRPREMNALTLLIAFPAIIILLVVVGIVLKDVPRVLGMGWLIIAFTVGQVLTWPPFGDGWKVLTWSAGYHPNARSVIGGILFFAIIPSVTLTLAIAASASGRWIKGSKLAIRILSLLTVLITVLLPIGDEAGFILFVLPFAITHITASLVIAATLGRKKA